MLRLSRSSHEQPPKRRFKARNREIRERHYLVDRISILPDDLLALQLVWTFTTRLDFDGLKSLAEGASNIDGARSEYVKWVNHVIALCMDYRAPIEFFRICFDFDKSSERDIDEWVRYALERKVQILELDLIDYGCFGSRRECEYYTFPFKFLSRENGDCSNYSQPWSLRRCNSMHIKQLKILLLNYVNVNDGDVEFILYNCPLLEDLSVRKSAELSTLKISGQCPSLRCLAIRYCRNLSSVEICDSNIVSLEYRGRSIHFILENVPMLVNLVLEAMRSNVMKDLVPVFSGILPQLQTFKIYAGMISWRETRRLYSTVKLSNLKELVVNVGEPKDWSFLPITNLIHASPRLERLIIETTHTCNCFYGRSYYGRTVSYHAHLKEVRFVGYKGADCDVEFVMHLAKNVASLGKIVVDTSRDSLFHPIWKYKPISRDRAAEREYEAFTRAQEQLKNKIPPTIHLEIL